MHSSSAAWVRGGMRLISSTSSRSVKTGPAWKAKSSGTGAQNRGAENVGRHQVGRSLHALKAEAEQTAQSLDDQRLGDAGNAFEQRVALAEYGDQDLFDHLILAGDDAAQLGARVSDQLAGRAQALRVFGLISWFLLFSWLMKPFPADWIGCFQILWLTLPAERPVWPLLSAFHSARAAFESA